MSTRTICPPDHKHDETLTCGTRHGCNCDPCETAVREHAYWRSHMIASGRIDLITHRLVDATGTRRRLQALMTLGYSQSEIARRLGTNQATVSTWLTLDRVQAITRDRLAELYQQLSDTPAPMTTKGERMSVVRTVRLAERRGYARPIDWDDIDDDEAPQTGIPAPVDEIAIVLALSGHQVNLTREERHIAVTTLNRDRGYDDQVIGRMLGVSSKTIARDREELGLPAAVGPDRQRIAS